MNRLHRLGFIALAVVAVTLLSGSPAYAQGEAAHAAAPLNLQYAGAAIGVGLVVIGAHTPEFPFERDLENVRRAVRDMQVGYPVAVDSAYGVWDAFANRYWPALYLADQEGTIRYHHFGEGRYTESERAIQELLGVNDELVAVVGSGLEAPADWNELEDVRAFWRRVAGDRAAAGVAAVD